MIPTLVFSCLCFVSIAFNVFLIFKLKTKPIQRKESIELEEFLHDLLGGDALVRVHRIAPVDFLIRSPRNR